MLIASPACLTQREEIHTATIPGGDDRPGGRPGPPGLSHFLPHPIPTWSFDSPGPCGCQRFHGFRTTRLKSKVEADSRLRSNIEVTGRSRVIARGIVSASITACIRRTEVMMMVAMMMAIATVAGSTPIGPVSRRFLGETASQKQCQHEHKG